MKRVMWRRSLGTLLLILVLPLAARAANENCANCEVSEALRKIYEGQFNTKALVPTLKAAETLIATPSPSPSPVLKPASTPKPVTQKPTPGPIGCGTEAARFEKLKEEYSKLFPSDQLFERKKQPLGCVRGSTAELDTLESIVGSKPPSAWEAVSGGCLRARDALEKTLGSEEAAYLAMIITKKTGYAPSISQEQNILQENEYRNRQRQLKADLEAKVQAGKLPPSALIPPIKVPEGPIEERVWSLENLRQMKQVLENFPPSMYHLPGMKAFYRARIKDSKIAAEAFGGTERLKSVLDPDGKTWRFIPIGYRELGYVVVFDSVYEPNPRFGLQALTHEIGHQLENAAMFGFERDKSPLYLDFAKLSGWKKTKVARPGGGEDLVYKHDPDAQFISDYAATDPLEDFAESVAHYMLYPDFMKTWAGGGANPPMPSKYDFIRDRVFHGKEYGTPDPWPALDQLLEKNGGTSQLLLGCLKEFGGSLRSKDGSRIFFCEKSASPTCTILTDRLRDGRCTESMARQWEGSLKNDEQYCENGGHEGLVAALQKRNARALTAVFSEIETLGLESMSPSSEAIRERLLQHSEIKEVIQGPLFDQIVKETQRISKMETEK